jgi:hypothetical protein
VIGLVIACLVLQSKRERSTLCRPSHVGTQPAACLCCSFAQERIRQRQERNISGMREGLAEGGEALGMGFYRGVTGLVSKPLEGAQSRGALGAPPLKHFL